MSRSTSSLTETERAQHQAILLPRYAATAKAFCAPRLARFLEQIPITLNEFADRAGNEEEREGYLHAIATIEAQRAEFSRRFDQELDRGLTQFRQSLAESNVCDGSLAALNPEESRAVDNLIVQSNATCFPALYALSQRLAVIGGGKKLKDCEIPAGPYHLVHAFRYALESWPLAVPIRLLLYALFHIHLTRGALTLYEELNDTLKSAGILPRTRPIRLKSGSNKNPPSSEDDNTQGHSETELLDSILALVTARREPSVDAGRVTGVSQSMRSDQDSQPGEFSCKLERQLLDMISALFEQMRTLPILPYVVKSSLSALQIPYLRLALSERSFVVNQHHPARLLFNEMIAAGGLWVDESNLKRGIFPAIEQTVEQLIAARPLDSALCVQLHSDFERRVREQRQRHQHIDQSPHPLSPQPEQLRQARQQAASEIDALIERYPLPEPVRGLLEGAWQERLTAIALHPSDDAQRQSWLEATTTAQQLAELFNPELSTAVWQTRLHELPQLCKRLRNGVTRMGSHNQALLAAVLDMLSHSRSLRHLVPSEDQRPAVSLESFSTPDQRDELIGMRPLVEETDLLGGASTATVRAMIEQLRDTKQGTWFELDECQRDGSRKRRRIQLSWISPLTSTCLVIDSAGDKVDLSSLGELAQALLNGQARVANSDDSTSTSDFTREL